MSDQRSVHTDALQTLGTIIESGERDAIHLAVEPVIAGEILLPGQDVGLGHMGMATGKATKLLGIVDPFLNGPVHIGQKFWLIVYPRQITSLRHVWSHPDFEEANSYSSSSKGESETWLRNFCENNDAPGYEGMMNLLRTNPADYIDDGYFHVGDLDGHCAIPPEFWVHVENVLGFRIGARASYFSCSC